VRLAADKVRPGGKVLMETVNPTSLITYANAFSRPRPRPAVHPTFPGSLFAEAGFASVDASTGRRSGPTKPNSFPATMK
jgi:hypothetical protein